MIHQNLTLTEEAVKAHCKRLKKKLQLLGQELSLTQVQKLFAQSLGFNDWNHLSIILRFSTIKNSPEKEILAMSESVKTIAIISSSYLIHTTLKLFLDSHDKYQSEIFNHIDELNSASNYDYIISDMNIDSKSIRCPIIYFSNDAFHKNLSKLFYDGQYSFLIDELKIYINANQGNVDKEYWKLLLISIKKISDIQKFNKIASRFSQTFAENIEFETFDFIPKVENNYFLEKPLRKEDLFKVLSYIK